ncbi:ketopantoate reductase family protein [Alkalitalea saponilacus]|uniref:2-dehydropantoate 2-reductase n=1 Tax=Alkalitalea saponilacus TaxID=889453 RepID=A0A1T5HTU7_9BACT|nr:2-dehydropantoate 2-reductase [Alkalitalea saponilacus]ASB50251.1 2-dehydropantoate 2-reductase [Alkalitalea saponilacus]SKC24113.1 2-dehydropantoate 2-reductase [Alkalitalea saponilacus]
MKVTIIGTGGVGAYFGGRMANAGHDVTFVARGEHLKAMLEKGLKVKSINDDFLVSPVKATSNISETGVSDLVIVAVKAWQLKDVAVQLKNVVAENTLVLPLQNGVLASEELKEVLPHKNVLAGLCRIISKIENPGIINHLAVEPTIVFGETDNSKTDRVLELNSIFEASGFKSMVANDIQSELWKKFISICVSALLAVTRSTYGEVREQPETREMMCQLFKEVADVAAAMNVYIKEGFVDKTMGFIDTFPYDSTSSLTRDIWEGKPSELEYQNGTVVRMAEKAGVDVPVNRFIYQSLILMEKRARS